ncbi:MAG TPA: cytochrome c-type biogenesis protein [Caulobacteraceae bacterium]|jgi:cytochrome c-type biogenesis protein CcmH|nr:cytochrome c-type biogenesis protein [Caulobacteraceae bacterium]
MRRWPLVIAALLCLAAADDPADRLHNPAQEARARSMFRETRCLVCQGESIDDSDAPLAADLRRVIRERVAVGASDGQVRSFLVARYGDFVLFRPQFTWANAFLWTTPFLIALAGAAWLVTRGRAGPQITAELSPEEEARLAALEHASDTFAPELRSKNASGLTER